METIAPLAKVLAEANGIEWRSLHGTGNAGMITETDILGYLARVMSGEEDAPTTPVDPMPSPAELAVYSSPEMLSRAGVEPELAEFLKAQQDQIQHVQTQHSAPPEMVAPPVPSMSSSDIAVPDIAVPSVSMPSAVMSDLAVPDLVVPEVTAAEIVLEPVVAAPVTPEPTAPTPAFEVPLAAEDDFAEPAFIHTPAPAPEDEFELEEEPVEAQAPAAQVQPVTPPPLPQAPAKPASGGLLSGLLSSLYRRNDPPAPQAPTQPTPAQPTPTQPVAATPAVSSPEVVKPAVVKPEVKLPELGVPPAAALALPEPELAVHADVVPPISTESSAEERVLPPVPVLGEVIVPDIAQPADTAKPTDTAEPAPFAPSEPEVAPVPLPAPQLPSVAAATVPNITVPAAAWAGTYLRREVDLSAMQSAREQLSDLVGDLPLTLMLARAAQRHLGLLNLSSVAVANVSGQALDADLSGDLRSGIKALSDAKPAGSEPAIPADLLILDAGELDLDDLHYPHAVTLSLGRVQNGKSALSLNGDLDVQQAARFLAEVSALLATPVKLLV
ncbi:hypothetical protein FNU79_16040 [Deinococcus detaillensis]|uniref:Peripheral subunit-binding (PSBD) domain-containing protein n=1 Tax=Deinococcus detaillensis TaxID=2592048 RepID=A0A553UKW4_9DEIO|nr:E3 binding domain-containing protein [Deinococcus detaillensis]TSA80839.1 hypothetical protein FNU79_16040 [Deinococcus detaillensis]